MPSQGDYGSGEYGMGLYGYGEAGGYETTETWADLLLESKMPEDDVAAKGYPDGGAVQRVNLYD
jgi:hypothetical protein